MITLENTQDWDVIRYCEFRNHPSWGSSFTISQYYEREKINYQHSLCNLERDNSKDIRGDFYWVLKDTKVTNQETNAKLKNIVASCEILVRDSFYLDSRSSSEIKPCYSAVIGSVFTFPEFRSKGYASEMLRQLVMKMKQLLPGKYDYSFLYSEVGEFYSQFGFNSKYIPISLIPLKNVTSSSDNDYIPLTTNFEDQINIYSIALKQLMLSEGKAKSKHLLFCLKPQQRIIEWFNNRSRHGAVTLAKFSVKQSESLVFGIQLKNSSSFMIWYLDFVSKQVTVLMFLANTFSEVKKMIRYCKRVVPNSFNELVFWESELFDYKKEGRKKDSEISHYIVHDLHGKIGQRNGSLSAFTMLHQTIDPERIEWICNSKVCWF